MTLFGKGPIVLDVAGRKVRFRRPDAMTQMAWVDRMQEALVDGAFRPQEDGFRAILQDLATYMIAIDGEPVEATADALNTELSYREACEAWVQLWHSSQITQEDRDPLRPQSGSRMSPG